MRIIDLILFIVVSFVLHACVQNDNKKVDAGKNNPNIVFILVDDLGYGDVSCYGQKILSTPHIDQLAAEGISFTNFYCGSTVCAPSRASLLTGKHTGHCSVRGNHPDQLLDDDELTIAKVLKKAGYVTGAIGKWGVGHPPPADDPYKKGFDQFFGFINMVHAHNYYPEFLYRDGQKVELKNKLHLIDGVNPWADMSEGAGVAEVREEYVHDLFDKEAIQFIDNNKDAPFFLYLAYTAPHTNNQRKPDGMEVPDYYEFADMNWPTPEKGFAAMIRNIDNSVGMVSDKLKTLGLEDNTMVIFCSDNGPHKESGHNVEFFDSNGPYRGLKRDFYDGGIKTPFIVRWPGIIKAGSTSDHVGAFWDVLPTFCDIVDVEKPKDIDGISFLPTLHGVKSKQQKHDYLYWEFYEQGGKQAILKDNWKAIKLNLLDPSNEVIFELYDLSKDEGEINNVAGQNPQIVDEMEKIFISARDEFPIVPLFKKDLKRDKTSVARTPPMGWNSFDAYDCRINENEFRNTVDFMAEHLLKYGWEYAVIDYIWWHPEPGNWDTPRRKGHPNIRYKVDGKPLHPDYITMDEYGRLLPAVKRFPSSAGGNGFKPIADYVHSKGMKFGIHIMRGIPRYAAFKDTPILGTEFRAKQIAEPWDTCSWNNHMYGVDPGKPGAQEYYNSLFKLYAEWGVDYIKADDTMFPSYHKGEIELIWKAIQKCGRPMVLSLSPGEAPLGRREHLINHSNMWRISGDFWDNWKSLHHSFDLLNAWSTAARPGHWPDADMLPIGRISLDDRPHGPERNSQFSWPEHYTLLTLWSIAKSPLMLGADLLSISDSTMFFLTNPEVIEVSQKSKGNRQAFTKGDAVVWIAKEPASGDTYLALFNLEGAFKKVTFELENEDLRGTYLLRDLWKRKNIGIIRKTISADLEPHGAALYRLSPK
jgi:arylsulfatase A-like enzyme